MFKRFALISALMITPTGVIAQSVQDSIIAQLQAQGFGRIEISRTLLGRVRLKAFSTSLERELIFNPTTGEILRDRWDDIDADEDHKPRVLNPNGGGVSQGSGSQNDDDDDDDDTDDDEADDVDVDDDDDDDDDDGDDDDDD